MEILVWMRVPGDVAFAAGSVFLALYALNLLRRRVVPPLPVRAARRYDGTSSRSPRVTLACIARPRP